MKAVNIRWDTDGDQEALAPLPTEMRIPDHIRGDAIDDYLSNETGWCHFGYGTVPDDRIKREKLMEDELPGGLAFEAYRLESFADALDVWDALFRDRDDRQTAGLADRFKHAKYPCWALFWTGSGTDGGCAGTISDVRHRIMTAFDRIDANG